MEKQFNYVTKLDIKFDHLQRMDIPQMVKDCKDKWFNQTLTKVNESVVRLGIVEGEYHWHKHDNDISPQAVKKQARIFKSVLKLDKNFHIYIHGNRELIQQGTEKDGRKYYKIYFENES